MSSPLVTIGLPVYNSEEFVERAIISALTQTFSDFELIISDNASTDSTGEICRRLANGDARIRYSRQERNVGVARNFAATVSASSGRYFKWLASDDLMAPAFLERCLPALESEPRVVISTAHMPYLDTEWGTLIPHDGKVTSSYGEVMPWINTPAEIFSPRPSDRFRVVLNEAVGNLFTELYYGLVRGNVMRLIKPVGYHIGAEKAFLLRLVLMGEVRYAPDDLLLRGMHPGHFGGRSRAGMIGGLNPDRRLPMALSGLDQVSGYVRAAVSGKVPMRDKLANLGALVERATRKATLGRLLVPGPENYFGWGGRKSSSAAKR